MDDSPIISFAPNDSPSGTTNGFRLLANNNYPMNQINLCSRDAMIRSHLETCNLDCDVSALSIDL
jgi:hypothetical protein